MISEKLPKTINLIKFVDSQQRFNGAVDLSKMKRLSDAVAPNELTGSASFSVEGKIFTKEIKGLQGEVKATLPLICQRCMKPFNYEIISGFKLALVFNEDEIEHLPADFEPLLLSEPDYDLSSLAEDELLLALPTVATHKREDCNIKQDSWVFGKPEEFQEKENPFEKLADLKEKLKREK